MVSRAGISSLQRSESSGRRLGVCGAQAQSVHETTESPINAHQIAKQTNKNQAQSVHETIEPHQIAKQTNKNYLPSTATHQTESEKQTEQQERAGGREARTVAGADMDTMGSGRESASGSRIK
jgi:hypothetical protein